ncbi:contractile injection system tape measure protein [Herbaspirillum seropedicae]|uniref:contractile injection system tape measure protein n=1 Tax=Herbaspirillum seropedicae TaxID=964 RepID=UPI003F8CFCBC
MPRPHRIDEFVFDVQLAKPGMPLAQAERLRELLVDQVLPMIDALFDQLGAGEVLWRIDRLDLDIGEVTAAQLPDMLIARLRQALLEAMQTGRSDDPPTEQSELLAFLAHGVLPETVSGRLPGSGDREALDHLLERVLARDVGAFLRAVAASPQREAMLTRLAHQFASTRQQALLAALPPSGMTPWMSGMNRLEAGLRRAGLPSAEADGARRAAWRLVFSRGLAAHALGAVNEQDENAVLQALLVAAIEWLAQQQRRTVPTVARSLLSEWQGGASHPRSVTSAQDAADHPSSGDEVLVALVELLSGAKPPSAAQANASSKAHAPASAASERTAPMASRAIDAARVVTLDDAEPAPSEAARSGVQARIRAALMQEGAADVYAHWPQWRTQHPDLLRSALLHYGAYSAVADRLAATWPLSLLLDMLELVNPDAARLAAAAWEDASLAALVAPESGHRAWRRQWWRAALARCLTQKGDAAQLDREAQHGASAADDWPGIASDLQWPESVHRYLRRVAWTSKSAASTAGDQERSFTGMTTLAASSVTPTTAGVALLPAARTDSTDRSHGQADAEAPPLSTVLADIRAGHSLARKSGIPLTWLVNWVQQLAPELRFRDAIAHHAQPLTSPSDRAMYYARVLEALARQHPVDLEECATIAQDGVDREAATASPQAGEQRERPTGRSASAASPADATTMTAAASLPVPHGDANGVPEEAGPGEPSSNGHQEDALQASRWTGRLAAAFMRADPSLLYADWDELVRTQAALVLGALRHYGGHEALLEALSKAFPESMLRDMAVLLLPALATQWEWLHEADVGAAPAGQETAAPDPAALAAWRRRLWLAILQLGLSSATLDEQADRDQAGAAWAAFEQVLQAQQDLVGLPWQRFRLAQWAAMAERTGGASPVGSGKAVASHVPGPITTAVPALHAVALETLAELDAMRSPAAGSAIEPSAPATGHAATPSASVQVAAVSAALAIPESLRAAWRARFALLSVDMRWLDGAWEADALQALTQARLLAGEVEVESAEGESGVQQAATPADVQRRHDFFALMLRQAPGSLAEPAVAQAWSSRADIAATPLTPAEKPPVLPTQESPPASASTKAASKLARQRYWREVLHALLTGQVLDLEDILARSHASTIAPGGVATMVEGAPLREPASRPHPASSPDSEAAMSDNIAAHLAYLRRADFSPATRPPARWLAWLQRAITAPASTLAAELTPALTSMSHHGPAVQALLAWLPAELWRALTALSPRPAAQVRQLLAVATDVADLYAQAAGVGEAAMSASVRRFLLPWLFQDERLFTLAAFCGELVAVLEQDLGSMPPTLPERLQRQMGVSLTATVAVTTDAAKAASVSAGAAAVDFPAEGMSIANAGLVLLWPFIARAWEHLQLTREGRFQDEQAMQRAAWLLQHAVFGHVDFPEYHLSLNKLLCGMPLGATIATTIDVTAAEDELIKQLLGVVIKHWSALGNTSVPGLRETFLQRQGRLFRKEDGWHLHIPTKTFDMLLDRLPWSIGTIRLPWMQDIVWVNWR